MSKDGTVQHNLESVEALRHRPPSLSSQSTSWSGRGTHRLYPQISITESDEHRDDDLLAGRLPIRGTICAVNAVRSPSRATVRRSVDEEEACRDYCVIMQLQGIIMCGLVRRLIGRAVCVLAGAADREGIRLRDVSVHLAVRFDAVFNREVHRPPSCAAR
jgi:hypothetical protein